MQASSHWARIAPGLPALLGYQRADLPHDLIAGLSVAAVALPVGVAYAQLAGFNPVHGLYASILPLVAYALFGTSRQLIIGPDAATCAMVAASVAPLAAGDPGRYLSLSMALAALAGVFCIAASFLRLGGLANFLSKPILVGFLNGISLHILVGQFGKLFGFAVSGADSRTAMNDSAGGRTQVAGLVSALAIALVLLFLTSPLRFVPIAALGAVLIKASLSLLDVPVLRQIYRLDRAEFALSLLATIGVIWVGAINAILVVVILAVLRFVRLTETKELREARHLGESGIVSRQFPTMRQAVRAYRALPGRTLPSTTPEARHEHAMNTAPSNIINSANGIKAVRNGRRP